MRSCAFVRERAPSQIILSISIINTINSGWVKCALFDTFLHGLAEGAKDKRFTRDLPEDLDQLISLAIRVDSRLEECRRVMRPPVCSYQAHPRSSPPLAPPAPRLPPRPEPESMVVNRSRISREEREEDPRMGLPVLWWSWALLLQVLS